MYVRISGLANICSLCPVRETGDRVQAGPARVRSTERNGAGDP